MEELREHALVIGEVTLTSGRSAEYYVDAKRAILRPEGFAALGELLAAQVAEWEGTAVGGITMGADPVACAALAGGAQREGVLRAQGGKGARSAAAHRGPAAEPRGPLRRRRGRRHDRRLDARGDRGAADAGHEICGVISVLDRLAGGGAAIEPAAGAPYVALTHDRRGLPRSSRSRDWLTDGAGVAADPP